MDTHRASSARASRPPRAAPPRRNRRAAVDPDALRRAAGRAVSALKALANEDRLLLLCALSQGEASVGALEERLDIRQPTLSQQLGVLRAQGAVETRRDGRHVHYRVADRELLAILRVLYRVYCPED